MSFSRLDQDILRSQQPSRNTLVDGGGSMQTGSAEADINFNASLAKDDEKDPKKFLRSSNSSFISSQNQREEMVCRICLGTEEEGTPADDG